MPKKQDTRAIDEWQQQNVDRIVIKPNKRENIPERIEAAINAGFARTRQAYILDAIREKLERDGIPMIEKSSDE